MATNFCWCFDKEDSESRACKWSNIIMIHQIPQERQLTVTGYIRLFVSLTIPSPIMHMCILYYGNHCPCTQCCNENNHLIHYKKHNISVLIPNLVHKCFSNNIA
eukprot:397639_1